MTAAAETVTRPKPGILRAYWQNWSLIVLAFLALELSFLQSLQSGMPAGQLQQSPRYQLFGFPLVLSQLYFGRPYDYVGYKRIEIEFEDGRSVLEEIEPKVRSMLNFNENGLFYILADDKGIVDFTRLAFLFYGIRTESLFYMHFTTLVVSFACFATSYFKDCAKLALLVLYCLALLAIMPVFDGLPPGENLIDSRIFTILCILPALHVLLSATESNPARRSLLIPTLVQGLILTFVYHVRASSLEYALLVVLSYPVIVYFAKPSSSAIDDGIPPLLPSRLMRFAPLSMLLIALAALPVYQRLTYNEAYFGERATTGHVFYHTLLTGMQWNPVLRDRYGLGAGDLGTADAVDAYLFRTGEHRTPELRHWAWSGQNTVTTQLPFDWRKYEAAARGLYFYIWRMHPKDSLLTYVYYHPLDVYTNFMTHVRFPGESVVATNNRVQLGLFRGFYDPFAPPVILLVILTGLITIKSGARFRPIYCFIALVIVASALVIPIVFYSAPFILLADFFVVVGFLLYTTVVCLVSFVGHQALRLEALIRAERTI